MVPVEIPEEKIIFKPSGNLAINSGLKVTPKPDTSNMALRHPTVPIMVTKYAGINGSRHTKIFLSYKELRKGYD